MNQQKSEEQVAFEKKSERLESLKRQVKEIKQKIGDVED